jgi:hypothetical protein
MSEWQARKKLTEVKKDSTWVGLRKPDNCAVFEFSSSFWNTFGKDFASPWKQLSDRWTSGWALEITF